MLVYWKMEAVEDLIKKLVSVTILGITQSLEKRSYAGGERNLVDEFLY